MKSYAAADRVQYVLQNAAPKRGRVESASGDVVCVAWFDGTWSREHANDARLQKLS